MTIYDRELPPSEPEPEPESSPEPDIETEAAELPELDVAIGEPPEAGEAPSEEPSAEAASGARGRDSLTLRLLAVPLLVAVCAPTLFLGLGRSSLWEPDEPRFAEASREMLASGDYLTPTFNGQPRFEKPILFYWMQALSFRELGVNEYTARMPAALAGLGCVLLVYLIGLRLFSARAGLLAAIALATTFRFAAYGRSGLTDVPVLFFILVALYGFIRAAEAPPPGGRFALLAWIAIGLAVLTKGPVGVIPLVIWVPYLVLTGRLGGLRRLRFSTGVLLALVIAAPWYLYMAWTHGRTFVEFALLSEVVARYASPDFPGPARDAFYYLKVWPGDAAPWTLYFIGAIAFAIAGWRTIEPERRAGVGLCIIWFVAVLVLCSFSEYKLPHYLLPLYPAIALLVGFLFDRAAGESNGARGWCALSSWLTALVVFVFAGLVGWFLRRMFGTSLVSLGMAPSAGLACAGIFMAIFQRTSRPLWVFGTIAPIAAFAYAFLAVDTIPRQLERFKPVRPLSNIIASRSDPDRRIGLYGDKSQGFVFYTGSPVAWLDTPDQASAFLAEDGLRFCVMPAADLESVRSRYAGMLYRIGARRRFNVRLADLMSTDPLAGTPTLILITNRRPESTP